jgi:hypothetical protein
MELSAGLDISLDNIGMDRNTGKAGEVNTIKPYITHDETSPLNSTGISLM